MVDFTPPFYTSGVSAVLLKEPAKHKPFEFLAPFDDGLWCLIAASIILYGIFLFLTSRLGETGDNNEERLTIFKSLSTVGLAFIQQEGDFTTRKIGERMIMVIWRVYSLILIATYTANFTAFLSNSIKDTGVKTFAELLNHKNMTFGLEDNTSNYDFFKYSRHDKYRKAFEDMLKWGTIYPPSNNISESLDRLTTTNALITDNLSIRLMKKENADTCRSNIYETNPINFEEQAFVMRRGLPQKEEINRLMRNYGRSGYLTNLIFNHWPTCTPKPTPHAVDIDRLYGFFAIMGVCAIIALISPWVSSWDMTKVKMIRFFKAKCAPKD